MKPAVPFLKSLGSWASAPGASIAGCSHRHAGDQRNGAEALHTGLFRGSPGTELGRWTTKVRHLSSDIRHLGYTASCRHLARFLAPWLITSPDKVSDSLQTKKRRPRLCSSAGSDDRSSDFAANSSSPLRETPGPDE